jgi:putative flippase GtrA
MRSFHRLSRQFGGFLAVGGVNTLLSLLLYEGLILFIPYWLAYALSFLVGIAFLLFANSRLVFGRPVTVVSAASFVAYYLVTYAAGFAIVMVQVEALGVPAGIAPLFAIAVTAPINFIGSRFVLGR